MSLGVLLVNEVTVVGTYQFNIVLGGQFHQHLVGLLLQGVRLAVGADVRVLYLMALKLQVIVVAEYALVPLHGLLRSLDVALQYFGRHLAGYTRRADDESFMVSLEVGAVGTGSHVEAVNPRAANQLDKVLISLVVLCQHNQVVTALVAMLFHLVLLGVPSHVHLTAQNGLELRLALFFQLPVLLLAVVEKLLDAHHVAMVGHGHAAHAVGDGLVDELLYTGLPVEDAVISMYVKVDEILHGFSP